jgi:hypothetical protein
MHGPVNLKTQFVVTSLLIVGPYARPGMESIAPWRGGDLDVQPVVRSIDRAIATAKRLGVPTCDPVTEYNATHKAIVTTADGKKHVGFGENAAESLWYALSEAVVEAVGTSPVSVPTDLPAPYDKMRLAMAAHFDRELQNRQKGSLTLAL